MQKLKIIRWPSRNPFGDACMYKMKIIGGHTFIIPMGATGMGYPSNAGILMNDGAAITASFGAPPGLSALANAFDTYKISAIKQKVTYWPLSAVGDPPLVGFIEASADLNFAGIANLPTIIYQPEQRWIRYKVLNFANQGGRPAQVSAYFSVNKVYGPDLIVKGSAGFVGHTQLTAPYFAAPPATGPFFRTGIITMSGVGAPAPISVVVKVETVLYIKFFGKRDLIA